MKAKMDGLEALLTRFDEVFAELERMKAQRPAAEPPPVGLPGDLSALWRAHVGDLARTLSDKGMVCRAAEPCSLGSSTVALAGFWLVWPEAASILRGLIGKLELTPYSPGATWHRIELCGGLGGRFYRCATVGR
ncbi:hypothetical protein [Cereibacter sphaeroides]|uniref:hypothetical protein n=3 Tax=Cereibacter sphaeroides TaxID=1063 RepID=UPI0015FD67EA|nr:hypothetical protein [Cereibacter sphaeroides]